MLSAMHDPCLFHSTLFAASAHLDGLFGIADNPRTIYHQLQAVKLLRERLTQPHFRVNYETIGAVLGLGYFDIVIGNVDGVQAHNQGLIQMLTTKHDQGPDTEALLGLANMTHFTRAMVSHTDALSLPHSSISSDKGVHPVNPLSGISPSSLLSRVLARAAAHDDILTSPVFTPDTVLDLIGVAHVVTQQDANTPLYESLAEKTAAAAATTTTPTILTLGAEALRRASLYPSFENQSPMAQHMNKCVQLAAKICRKHLLLRAHAPEAYVWVCFTAAAAAAAAAAAYDRDEKRSGEDHNDDWTSFILTPMPVITATDSAELRLMREGVGVFEVVAGEV
ncbi:uncharacterized protein N7496_010931 [Penicillium cataractarum]|uniref:Uncharacterized protein n=1 Tax=Penicillium cataractarum TaxID=2100454 RepID=A0A9W9RE13_9EURO|nr:uncharacterized protein N7496_010931 [Penicillium cataractarum]KAJ5358518.1 hypothetical protein N7496_010931 [Penicillium cataractarum]